MISSIWGFLKISGTRLMGTLVPLKGVLGVIKGLGFPNFRRTCRGVYRGYLGFRDLFGEPKKKDYSIYGSIFGVPLLRETVIS